MTLRVINSLILLVILGLIISAVLTANAGIKFGRKAQNKTEDVVILGIAQPPGKPSTLYISACGTDIEITVPDSVLKGGDTKSFEQEVMSAVAAACN